MKKGIKAINQRDYITFAMRIPQKHARGKAQLAEVRAESVQKLKSEYVNKHFHKNGIEVK